MQVGGVCSIYAKTEKKKNQWKQHSEVHPHLENIFKRATSFVDVPLHYTSLKKKKKRERDHLLWTTIESMKVVAQKKIIAIK